MRADIERLRYALKDAFVFKEEAEEKAHTLREELAQRDEKLEIAKNALKAIEKFIPNTSASEGGAAKFSAHVAAADKVRAAIAALEVKE